MIELKTYNSLYAKLSASLLILVVILAVMILWIAQQTSDMYSQEVTQKLNGSIAMYVTDADQLIVDGQVNQAAMSKLAQRAMTINPTVEVYLLDTNGNIFSHELPVEDVKRSKVSLRPIRQFLAGQTAFPIFGDDPRHTNIQKVFSVSPVIENDTVVGYLYAVLGGKKFDSIKAAVEESYILQMGAVTIIGSIAIVALAALAIFFFLTRRIRRLKADVEKFEAGNADSNIQKPEVIKDEIDQLRSSFYDMSQQIQQQFTALQSLDNTRRELVANVSHDLRTPLASMQGYIETLIIKDDELTSETRLQHLKTAYKHSKRLNTLIAELFELARLDSDAIEIHTETFSLLELVHDCVQDCELEAKQKKIEMKIEAPETNCFVRADIALIQRVLQNLLGNALAHTPAGRSITVKVNDNARWAVIEVCDTGRGIAKHEIPHIFERYYYSQKDQQENKVGSGLGLAIVKKILELHQSTIAVESETNKGTSFTFALPLPV